MTMTIEQMESQAFDYAVKTFNAQLSPIASFLKDPDVQEIMINAPDDIWVEKRGEITKTNAKVVGKSIDAATKALCKISGSKFGPVVDTRMPGFRIAYAGKDVSVKGPSMSIRKHSSLVRGLETYLEEGAFNPFAKKEELEAVVKKPDISNISQGGKVLFDFLDYAVKSKKNIVVAGGTGSGKTTFVNSLLSRIPDNERVLTIEDTAELDVKLPNYVSFETYEAYEEEKIDIRRLIKLSLRYRPDRIIVGEVRGGEAYDLLDAMNTGHDGGICTLHASSPQFAMYRLESMVRMNSDAQNLPLEALRNLIAGVFDLIIYCERKGGVRRPTHVSVVDGLDGDGKYRIKTLFRVEYEK